MASSRQEGTGGPPTPESIRPGPDVEEPLDIDEGVRGARRRPSSLTERYEARVDSLIAELGRDKQRLEEEVRRLRGQEIHHLRDDLRWLEDLASWQGRELARLRTSYASAIGFSWISFALIAIGGCVVSYATFVHIETQRTIATAGLVGLFVGVGVQGYNSWMGSRLEIGRTDPPASESRPRPNPTLAR